MEFNYFLIDNKSGHKTKEQWFSKNHPEEYKKIIDYSLNISLELNFKEKIWFYFNELTERPKCCTCGGEIKFRDRFDKPYGEFCKLECINDNKDEMIKRQKETFQKRYGVNFYPEHEDFLKKQFKTKEERYGDGNYNNMEKNRQTKLEKYGDQYFNNPEKMKETSLKKYGKTNHTKTKKYKKFIHKKYRKIYYGVNILEIDGFNIKIKCDKCSEVFDTPKHILYSRYKSNYIICTKCNPLGQANRSGKEDEITKFLNEINIVHEQSNRKILKRKELDFYLPNEKVAIEYNGLFWHNELFRDENYHLNKTNECAKIGVNLLHIFEDEWLMKKDIIKSLLKNKFSKSNYKINGNDCIINEVDNDTSNVFLLENNINGITLSDIKLGLYYNLNLVSLITFSKINNTNDWEINRFCNILNTNVIGAMKILMNFFIKNNKINKLFLNSDIRFFNNTSYEKIGFTKIDQTEPNYWYVINGVRHDKNKFTKDILVKEGFDPNKTEKEIMLERKIYRIYDCGNIRWEYQNN